MNWLSRVADGVATISRLLKIIGLFCKRALEKRRYSAKETYNFQETTNPSHPICVVSVMSRMKCTSHVMYAKDESCHKCMTWLVHFIRDMTDTTHRRRDWHDSSNSLVMSRKQKMSNVTSELDESCHVWIGWVTHIHVYIYMNTGWCRVIGCLAFRDRFLQKSPEISGSFAERDLQLIRHSM